MRYPTWIWGGSDAYSFVLPLILAFAPAAVCGAAGRAARGGYGCLGAFALLALILAALVLSDRILVPSGGESYSISWCSWGHLLLFTNAALTVAGAFERALWTQLITAFVGCLVGLAVGFVVAVYGLGVWS